MKIGTILLFLLASVTPLGAVVLHEGDSRQFAFDAGDLSAPVLRNASDGAGWQVTFSDLGNNAKITVELFEDSVADTPFYSGQFTAPDGHNSPGGHAGIALSPPSWRDLQGVIRVSVVKGAVNISRITAIVYQDNTKRTVIENFGEIDSDLDGIPDANETNNGVFVSPESTGTHPNNPDSDGDGLRDGEEVFSHGSDPNIVDTDDDGFDDGFEVKTGFDPGDASSTPDAVSSIRTAVEFRFNAAVGESYRIEATTDLQSWNTIEDTIPGTGGTVVRFYSTEGSSARYFRARKN